MRNPAARVSDPNAFVTAPGSPIHTSYEARFNGQTLVLVETGQENIQDRIEAFAPYTDINYMLHRLSLGDMSVVSQRAAMYGDFSGMPTNPVDAINVVRQAEERFGELSNDDKSQYNNDWRVWLAAMLSGGSVSRETAEPAEPAEPVEEVSE